MRVKCLWKDCESIKILSRGLCQRDYARARRAGILDQFAAPKRDCQFCRAEFSVESRGFTYFCSRACQLMMVEALRIADRWENVDGRLCDHCSRPISDSARDDTRHCSIDCQQGHWYIWNAERLRAQARAWAANNRERRNEYHHRREALKRGNQAERVDPIAVWERDGGACWLCRKPIDAMLKFPHPGSPSLDHKVPLARGGPHTYDNIAMACLGCNLSKGAKIVAGAIGTSGAGVVGP